jgi:hypothetical protein
MSNYRKLEVKSRSVTFSLPDAGVGLRAPSDYMRNRSSTHVLVQLLFFLISVLLRVLLMRKRIPSFRKRNGVVSVNF